MSLKNTTIKVENLLSSFLLENNLILWDIIFAREGSELFLTIYIDKKDEMIDITDCEKLSRYLDPILDATEFDSLPAYTLCVSSPGLERSLTKPQHFLSVIGEKIELKFYKSIDGTKTLTGILTNYADDTITLDETDKYNIKDIASAKLCYEF